MKILTLMAGSILLLAACSEEGFPISLDESTAPVLTDSSEEPINQIPSKDLDHESTEKESLKPNPFNEDSNTRIVPSKLFIPAIEVEAIINPYGLDEDGAMDVPDNGDEIAWFEPGYKPGQKGNAVLAGHVDSEKAPAVFWDLKELKPGDEVIVSDQKGNTLTFKVTGTKIYDHSNAPIQQIFGASSSKKLNLITCTGYFDRDSRNYVERMVVFTELIEETSH